jgi:hypothetical protein
MPLPDDVGHATRECEDWRADFKAREIEKTQTAEQLPTLASVAPTGLMLA